MYYYNRPINTYIFIFAFALSMIVILAAEGEFTWMGLGVSILWGLVALGGGNLLWAFVGDMLHPYIHRDRDIYEHEYEDEPIVVAPQQNNGRLTTPDTPLQNPGDEFERIVNKAINDGKLWAKGMTVLEPEEESQLRSYFKKRWMGRQDDIAIPDNLKPSLVTKLQQRGLVNDRELTTRGERVIPWGRTYQRVDGEPIM